jgi:hypothetical protein
VRKAIAAVVLLSCLAAPSPAPAQATVVGAREPVAVGDTALTAALVRGSRVRIRSSAVKGRPQGFVVALDDDVVTLANDGGHRVQVPVASITALETSVGRRRHWLRGAAIGAMVGLLVGLTAKLEPTLDRESMAVLGDVCFGFQGFCSRGEAVRTLLPSFALLGSGIGALIKTDRWSDIALNATPPPAESGRLHQGSSSERTAP